MPQGKHRDDLMSKAELRGLTVRADPGLDPDEREMNVRANSRDDWCVVYSEIPVVIRWVLSVPRSAVESYRIIEGDLVAIKAKVPKGQFKFQSTCRETDHNGGMVGYGDML